MGKEQLLKNSYEYFQNSSSLIPKIGCELEFFLLTENVSDVDDFIAALKDKNWQVEKERGATQIEVKTNFTADLEALCLELEEKKQFIQKLAEEKNLSASFASQPFSDDCGSSLQFNISLHDDEDNNLFSDDEDLLKNCITSLLSHTKKMMIFLAPKEEDYLRFSRELNQNLFKKGKFTAPINLSYGNDNRSCAIRIAKAKTGKRLEYRVAAADADPWLCISSLLVTLIQKSDQDFSPTFGNAFDEQFKIQNLCQTLDEAKKQKPILAKLNLD